MKRLYSLLFIITILCFATGCSNSNVTEEQDLVPGVYELEESGEPVKPSVNLQDNNRFVFSYSAYSSYLPIGNYEMDKNNLILRTDDGKYEYIFEIKNNTLVFNEHESSPIDLGEVMDGSVFKLHTKEVEI